MFMTYYPITSVHAKAPSCVGYFILCRWLRIELRSHPYQEAGLQAVQMIPVLVTGFSPLSTSSLSALSTAGKSFLLLARILLPVISGYAGWMFKD